MITLYAPIIASVLFFILLIKINLGSQVIFEIERLGYTLKFTNNVIGKTVLLVLSLNFLPIYLFMDFGKLFPTEFRMQVFFDSEGIKKSLSSFPEQSLRDLGVEYEEDSAQEYYESLDKKREIVTGKISFFFTSNTEVFSEGRTSYFVEKLEGIHRYRVSQSHGELTHTLVGENGQEEAFVTLFRKIPSSGDFIFPTIKNVLIDRKIVMAPRFKQIIAKYDLSSGKEIDHILTGITTVYLWPFPSYGNTIYLFRNREGKLTPIAYAVYY